MSIKVNPRPSFPAQTPGWITGNALKPLVRVLPGLALSGALAAAAMMLGRIGWLQDHGISTLTLAIVLGMLVGNTVFPRVAEISGPGVNVSKQKLLRLGVILNGLRLTVQDIGHVGLAGAVIDALMLGSTFGLACLCGIRWLGMDRKTAMLIGVGSAICGAAAVMAAEPVVKARAEQVTVAVATVVVFGTVAIFLYPLIFQLNQHWQLIPGGADRFGIYIGSTIHEVAQVVAAARSVDPLAADTAVIAKMVRVMMLAPFLVMLSVWLNRDEARRAVRNEPTPAPGEHTASRLPPSKAKLAVPWFAFAFVGMVMFNSLNLLRESVVTTAIEIDNILLAMAMAALGLSTHLSSIRKAGVQPLLLALMLFAWLVVGGALINRWVFAGLG